MFDSFSACASKLTSISKATHPFVDWQFRGGFFNRQREPLPLHRCRGQSLVVDGRANGQL